MVDYDETLDCLATREKILKLVLIRKSIVFGVFSCD